MIRSSNLNHAQGHRKLLKECHPELPSSLSPHSPLLLQAFHLNSSNLLTPLLSPNQLNSFYLSW